MTRLRGIKSIHPILTRPRRSTSPRHDSLAPIISERTTYIHHDLHRGGSVKTPSVLLKLVGNSHAPLEKLIAEAVRSGDRKLFNSAAQAWNHAFFWMAMSPTVQRPRGNPAVAIDAGFQNLNGLGFLPPTTPTTPLTTPA